MQILKTIINGNKIFSKKNRKEINWFIEAAKSDSNQNSLDIFVGIKGRL